MYRYAQINLETGMVVSDSHLSGIVESDNMIPISEDFDLTNKKYVDGEWVEYEPEPITEPEPTEQEIMQAEMLLNQMQIISAQKEQDEVLAEILLNQMEV